MSTSISINDHDALNAAFAEKVAGWTWRTFPDGACPDIKHWRDQNGEVVSIYMDGCFTRSMDAVLPYLEPDLVGISVPKCKGDTWSVHVAPDAAQLEYRAEAPTLPHAAVVALLRAKGVTVEEDSK